MESWIVWICLKNTHKYEYHYTRNLIASDEETNAYLERSPLENVAKIKSPVALMHGMDDPVVPYTQSMDYYKALKKCGVYTKIKLFKNEKPWIPFERDSLHRYK